MSGKHRPGEDPGEATETMDFAKIGEDIAAEDAAEAGPAGGSVNGDLGHEERAALARSTRIQHLARTPAQWAAAVRAAQYLEDHLGEPNAIGRAAGIMGAANDAPAIERYQGAVPVTSLDGQEVTCAECGAVYECRTEDPYFDSTEPAGGKCTRCVLAETSQDRPPISAEGEDLLP